MNDTPQDSSTMTAAAEGATELICWYSQPAERWTEALPIGNGRLGAMIFGGIEAEHVQLNEGSLWSGEPQDGNNPNGKELLPKIREAIFAEDYAEAQRLCREMQGPWTESYMPLGDLHLEFDPGTNSESIQDYHRQLDLDTAIATTRFRIGGMTFTREVFASAPDQVIVVRLTCDTPGHLSFRTRLNSPLRFQTEPEESNGLRMSGRAPKHAEPNYVRSDDPIVYDDAPGGVGMRFVVHVQVTAEGGAVTADADGLHVKNANSALLLLSAATSFNGFDRSPSKEGKDAEALASQMLSAAAVKSYEALRADHVLDHQALFRRVVLDLGPATTADLPTDERVARFHESDDPQLPVLLYQYGRYLMIAGSRSGGQPANLQGIWNDQTRPPWSSNYTININTEMNYWAVETCNTAECYAPVTDFMESLAKRGSETAKALYGTRGWCAHHNTDLWATSWPVGKGGGDPVYSNWPMGGAWMCQSLWEHYAFSGDRSYLENRAYPVLKEAARFCRDFLVEDGHGHLVTVPSTSPEHSFILPDGHRAAVSVATTMDMAIIHDLFTHCIQAAEILNKDADFAADLEDALTKLLPPQIGADGALQEWSKDWTPGDVHHRHVSHLFGLYPGNQITEKGTPELFHAVRQSLINRGDAGTGWSLAWKINLWARLRDGDHAYRLVRELLTLVTTTGFNYHNGAGVYANLFDAHPPFQIDGNYGATSGIAEMLLQSQSGELDLLPALPTIWPTGSVRGLRGRGGFTVDITWEFGKLTRTEIVSHIGGPCTVRYGEETVTFPTEAGSSYTLDTVLHSDE